MIAVWPTRARGARLRPLTGTSPRQPLQKHLGYTSTSCRGPWL
ncbi:hypothetical protein E2C01_011259 [Portunus trituberculatus]|uniref:Uncharacterized protein n=1 Tax=Portunus trituberculatus TaxID=210409 RepID=A0A5B7DAY3_PORTR|nr:hypothetical protein [Portunus trituberculatus]